MSVLPVKGFRQLNVDLDVTVKGFAQCGMGSCSEKQLIHANDWTCELLCLCWKGEIAILKLAVQPCSVTAPEVLGREGSSNSENEMPSQSKIVITLLMRVWNGSSV